MIIEQILNNAIQQVRNGENISSVVSAYPAEVQSELRAMLEITTLVSSLPRKSVPTPNHRRLYLQHSPATSKFGDFFKAFKIAPTILAAFLVVSLGTALGAQSSLPGDKLFAVKKSYESLQVKLATNPEKRADLQLKIASERFDDAQKVLATNNEANKKVAIAELNQQTSVALSDIKSTAVSISQQNPDLVKQAETLTKKQTSLISNVGSSLADSNVIKNSQDNNATIHDIKKIIAAANEETGAKIVPIDTISTSGTITELKNNSLKIDKNQFALDEKTQITDADNNSIKVTDLNINDAISVEARIHNDKNLAKSISVIAKAPVQKTEAAAPKEIKVEVKIKKPTPEASTPVVEPAILNNDPTLNPEVILPDHSKDTFGGFIPEPPAIFPATPVQK
jgi:hypothetical protein